jgi:chromosomal replication initiator protein
MKAAGLLRGQVADGVWQSTFTQISPLTLTAERFTLSLPNAMICERVDRRYRSLVEDAVAEAAGRDLAIAFEVETQQALFGHGETVLPPDTIAPPPGSLQRGVPSADPVIDLTAAPADELIIDGPERRLGPANGFGHHDSAPATSPPPTIGHEPGAGHGHGNRHGHGHVLGAGQYSESIPASGTPISSDDPATRYTFSSFVTGPSNRFATAAALSVAERPGGSYNPLFIYGSAGLGKTHILRAIQHFINDLEPHRTVLYVSTETFLNEFVDSIRNNSGSEFKRRYRQIDVLLIDDIQFIEGKDRLQEELFHTFNDLYAANRQIVLSSDRPPDAIPTLEERLKSRFMMGLLTDIQPPDIETRMAILRKRAERENLNLPNDVSEFIAANITNNIRELEGALNKVTAFANLNRQPMTTELAQQVLRDFIADRQPRPITVSMILEETSQQFNFSIDELIGKSRRRPLVIARQMAMYVTRELTDLSFPLIAREFGGRDHTTVMHACDKVGALMKERSQIYNHVTALEKAVRARAQAGDF